MKRIIFSLIALCLLLPIQLEGRQLTTAEQLSSPSQEIEMAMFGNTTGHWVTNHPPVIEAIGCVSSTSDLTTYTFAATNVGPVRRERFTFLLISMEDSATDRHHAASATVGGAAATGILSGGITNNVSYDIYGIYNPEGTSETVEVIASEAITAMAVCIINIYNLDSMVPIDLDTSTGAAGAAATGMDVFTKDRSVGFGFCTSVSGTAGYTWTGLTEALEGNNAEIQWGAAIFTEDDGANERTTQADTTSDAVDAFCTTQVFGDGFEPRIWFSYCTADASDASSYNAAAMPTGMPHPNRSSIIQINGEDSATNFNFTSLSIAGTAMSEINETGTAALMEAATYTLHNNSAGHVEDLALVMSEAIGGIGFCILAAYNLQSTTEVGQTTGTTTTGAAVSLNVNTVAAGVAAATCGSIETGTTNTWVGMTENLDSSTAETGLTLAIARGLITNESPRTMSSDNSSGTNDVACTIVSHK